MDSPGYHWNSNYSVHFWLEGGAKKSQLLLGMAAYGRGFMLANEVGTVLQNPKSIDVKSVRKKYIYIGSNVQKSRVPRGS